MHCLAKNTRGQTIDGSRGQLAIRLAEDVDVSVPSAVYPVISLCFSDHRVDVVGVLNFLDYQTCHPTIRKSPPRSESLKVSPFPSSPTSLCPPSTRNGLLF